MRCHLTPDIMTFLTFSVTIPMLNHLLSLNKEEICQVDNFTGHMDKKKRNSFAEKMKSKIDSAAGKAIYSMRLAVGEPPFFHIRSTIGLSRFTLCSKKK